MRKSAIFFKNRRFQGYHHVAEQKNRIGFCIAIVKLPPSDYSDDIEDIRRDSLSIVLRCSGVRINNLISIVATLTHNSTRPTTTILSKWVFFLGQKIP